jgi:anti-anti-sigma regulatory factor
MTKTADWTIVDGEHVAQSLQQVQAKLDSAEREVLLDFSAVRRIDPSGLNAMEELASATHEKSIEVVLRGVNVDVYKVLKLAKLTTGFSFVN